MTAGNLEGTTMEYIAKMLYDEDGDFLEWDEADEYIRVRYRRLAVRIIDTAEPVWRQRVGIEEEWGLQVTLSEEAHGPGVTKVYPHTEEEARLSAGAFGSKLVMRTVSPWREVSRRG